MASVIPVLRIFDAGKAREFYVAFLGFGVDWEHRFDAGLPLYMQVSRSPWVMHLSEHHGDATPGSAVRLAVAELDALQRELLEKDYRYCRPAIEAKPWGLRELTVTDPFGNRIVFFGAPADGSRRDRLE